VSNPYSIHNAGAPRRRAMLMVGSFAVLIAVGGWLSIGNGKIPDQETGCSPDTEGPTTVVLLDGSDPLGPPSEALVRQAVGDAAEGGVNSRLILARFSGKQEFRPEILFNKCSPGRGKDGSLFGLGPAVLEEEWAEKFHRPLEEKSGQFAQAASKENESFIAAAIARVASDPTFHLRAKGSRLIVLSDFIENSDISHPYVDGVVRLPEIREQFLSGIRIRLIELPALKGAEMLQGYPGRVAWRDWAQRAGAIAPVEFLAPGLAP
jgi:hypothetical protein